MSYIDDLLTNPLYRNLTLQVREETPAIPEYSAGRPIEDWIFESGRRAGYILAAQAFGVNYDSEPD